MTFLKNLPPEIITRINKIKMATGNTFNDLDLNGHPYDFKITTEPCYGRNHIMFIAVNKTNTSFKTITTKMSFFIKQELHILAKNNNNSLQKEVVYIEQCFAELLLKIQHLTLEPSLNDAQKFYLLNEFIYKNLHLRPLNIRVPLTEHPYNPHPLLENLAGKIDLPNHKHLYPADIHKAISGAALQTWNKETRSKAFEETQGKLNIEEVD